MQPQQPEKSACNAAADRTGVAEIDCVRTVLRGGIVSPWDRPLVGDEL
jgi:hypothetical protein